MLVREDWFPGQGRVVSPVLSHPIIFLLCVPAKSLQLCPTLCDPMNYSPPGSSVHGILQARILEWVAMPSSRGSSPPRDVPDLCLLCLLH